MNPNFITPTQPQIPVDADKIREIISVRAYFKAEKRGFIAGYDLEDWLEAEREVKNQCFYWFHDN